MSPEIAHIGKVLHEIRDRRGETQLKVAKKAGIANTFLCDIEKGRILPSLKTLEKLSLAPGGPYRGYFFTPQFSK